MKEIKIKIAGNESYEFTSLIKKFFKRADTRLTTLFDDSDKADILLITDDGLDKATVDLENEAFVILNWDEKFSKRLIMDGRIKLITYGFNPKACVTLSGVSDGVTMVCIQRAFKTFSGRTVVEQEFSVETKEQYDERNVLAAVTVALICDVLF